MPQSREIERSQNYCLHDLISQATGQHYSDWVPCPPQNAILSYTVNGIVPLQNGLVAGQHGWCGGSTTLTMNHAGGSGAVTYDWQWRRASDAQWSGTVSTEKTYTPSWNNADMLVVQCTATNNGVAVVDTHFVNYAGPCVVGVEQLAIAQLEIALSPNPVTGHARVALRMPHDAQVTMECLDVAGRLVRRRSAGLLRAGDHDITLGRELVGEKTLTNGVYFLRLHVGDETRVLRFAVMR
jgi:hypothetical protein